MARGKSEFIRTSDAVLFFLPGCKGNLKICNPLDASEAENCVALNHEKFSDKFIGTGAISDPGVLPLLKYPKKVKVSVKNNVEHVLKHLLKVNFPSAYG